MMAEHPLIFSGPMIRAILADQKTQTRRVIRRQPGRTVCDHTMDAEIGEKVIWRGWPHYLRESHGRNKRDIGELTPVRVPCPRGVPGDRLWAKETWGVFSRGFGRKRVTDAHVQHYLGLCYQATDETDTADRDVEVSRDDWLRYREPQRWQRWRSPRFMPKWATRLWLEVTEVRVQRVQDISEDDALAEGCPAGHWAHPPRSASFYKAKNNFRELWNSLNKARGYGWDLNPHVWAISFRRITDETDQTKDENREHRD